MLIGSAASIAIKLSHITVGFLLAVLLARMLGPEGYGRYAYVFAILSLLSLPAQFGLPTLLVRETAKMVVKDDWALLKGLWRWSFVYIITISLLITVFALGVGVKIHPHINNLDIEVLAWGLLLLPLMVLNKVRDSMLRGLGHVLKGQLSDSVARPLLFTLTMAMLGAGSVSLNASDAMAVHAVAAGLAFCFGSVLLLRARPVELSRCPEVAYSSKKWLISSLPLAAVSGVQVLNRETDIIMVGTFLAADQVGIYKVVTQGALIVSLGLAAMSMVLAPRFASLYAEGNTEALQRLAKSSSTLVFFSTLPMLLVFTFLGDWVLGVFFGKSFIGGHLALIILSVGYQVGAAFGAVGYLLTMTGHEVQAIKGLSVSAAVNILLNFLLIPKYGINGAAFATASSIVVWNILFWYWAYRRVGVDCLAFSFGVPRPLGPSAKR